MVSSSVEDKKNKDGDEGELVQVSKTQHTESMDDGGDDPHGDRSAEAAGVVRGLSRSILKSPIGRLPRRRIPIRRVARVSDRLSTGLDWYSSAVESSSTDDTNVVKRNDDVPKATDKTQNQKLRRRIAGRITYVTTYWSQVGWPRLKNFTINITKNTLLGLAVFETYGYVVSQLAPTEVPGDDYIIEVDRTLVVTDDDDEADDDNDGGHVDSVVTIQDEIDEYARASISTHFGAGFLAGSVHGILSGIVDGPTLGEAVTTSTRQTTIRAMASYTLYHGISHSCLFGAYECVKRSLLHQLYDFDHSTEYYGAGYLGVFAVSGGLAGQIQHVTSHYVEQYLSGTYARPTMHTSSKVPSNGIKSMLSILKSFPMPAARPTLMAFPPSAIGFIAFEYGKKFAT